MTNTIVIFGATGKQGGSVVEAFLHEHDFIVRGVTRNASSVAAEELKEKGVEVVQANLSDLKSLEDAVMNASIIYAMTTDFGINLEQIKDLPAGKTVLQEAHDIELRQGINLVRAASTVPNLKKFILSSLSAASRISGGKYRHVYHFDAKASAVDLLKEEYPELARKTLVLQLGLFATNWGKPTAFRPTRQSDGRWRILAPTPADAKHPFIDPNSDPAIFVKTLA